jgi:Flp pilus assembly CpaE family ATPase
VKSVALVDLDLQFGNVGVFLDLEDNGAFLKMIEAGRPAGPSRLGQLMQRHSSGVNVLCAPSAPVPLTAVTTEFVAGLIDELRNSHDYVVIDAPRLLVDWIAPVYETASRILLLTDTSVPCVRHARRLMDLYSEENEALSIELIVSRERRSLFGTSHLRDAERALQARISHWLPNCASEARSAVDHGKPIVETAARSGLAKAVGSVARDIRKSTQCAISTSK